MNSLHDPCIHSRSSMTWGLWSLLIAAIVMGVGCTQSVDEVREIQRRRNQQQRASADDDPIGEAFAFIATLAELDRETAHRRITGLLNTWLERRSDHVEWEQPAVIASLGAPWRGYAPLGDLERLRFTSEDVDYLRLNFVLSRLVTWAGEQGVDTPLWESWLNSLEGEMQAADVARLREVIRLFDWTVRNIALQPTEAEEAGPPAPTLPAGLEFRGAGYNQTPYETLFRGAGDPLQRARVFIQLCRQAGVDACMLGLVDESPDDPRPWAVGVRIGDSLYLFEPHLGIPIPGPDEKGVATLDQARNDPSVLRRMNVPGWFDYPVDAAMIQQTVALLDAPVESMSRTMADLSTGLVGDLRMVLAYDADASAAAFEEISGIVGAQLWPMDIQSRMYHDAIEREAASNPMIALWIASRWGLLNESFPLARARWKHLIGQFETEDDTPGAQVLYMQLRLPEFDIARLPSSPELQEKYNPILGSRRMLGESEQDFAQRMASFQYLLRLSKQAATYWISLIHYDQGQFETAQSWLENRVLDEDRNSPWQAAARYNLARSLEQQKQIDRAIEYLKTIGHPQEHGNRIRARLLSP